MSSEDVFGLYENTLSEEELYKLEVQKELKLLRDEERTKKAKEEAMFLFEKEKFEYLSKEENVTKELDRTSLTHFYSDKNHKILQALKFIKQRRLLLTQFNNLSEDNKNIMFQKYTSDKKGNSRLFYNSFTHENLLSILPKYIADELIVSTKIEFTTEFYTFNPISDLLEEEYEKRKSLNFKSESKEITDSNIGNLQFDYLALSEKDKIEMFSSSFRNVHNKILFQSKYAKFNMLPNDLLEKEYTKRKLNFKFPI